MLILSISLLDIFTASMVACQARGFEGGTDHFSRPTSCGVHRSSLPFGLPIDLFEQRLGSPNAVDGGRYTAVDGSLEEDFDDLLPREAVAPLCCGPVLG